MGRLPSDKKIMREMASIAFDPEEKTADRLRAMDMLGSLLHSKNKDDEVYEKLDKLLSSLSE